MKLTDRDKEVLEKIATKTENVQRENLIKVLDIIFSDGLPKTKEDMVAMINEDKKIKDQLHAWSIILVAQCVRTYES